VTEMANKVILGAGVKAAHLCDLFNLWGEVTQFYETPRRRGETKRGKPVSDEIIFTGEPLRIYSAVGDTRHKRRLVNLFKEEARDNAVTYTWGTLIHKTSVVTNPRQVGRDFIIRELSSVGSQCSIGNHVSIGPLANVSHNTTVGDYATICGQAAISGNVYIGGGVFIGQGVVVKPDIHIGDGAYLGAGAVVVKDVPPDTVVAGNPARRSPKLMKVPPW